MTVSRPTLASPLVVEYRAAGPYDVEAGVQRSDGYVFPATRDLLVRVPATIRRPQGITLRGGRNVLLVGADVDVSVDYGASTGLPRAVANRALYLDHRTAGVVHVEGLLVRGTHLYEAVNLLGSAGTEWQLVNILVADPVRWWPTGETGAGVDHDGGDVLQTLGSWASLAVEGLEARGATYQGLFCKREAGYTSGPIALTRVSLPSYSGPGAAYYSNPGESIQVTGSSVYLDPAPTSYGAAPGVVAFRESTKTTDSLVYGSMTLLGVLAGAPTSPMLTRAPGLSYGKDSMTVSIDRGAVVSGTADTVAVVLPAKQAGDYIQYIVVTPGRDATTNNVGGTDGRVLQDGGLAIYQNLVTVSGAAGATTRFRFPAGEFIAWAQVIRGDGSGNPPEPGAGFATLAGLTLPARGFFSGGSGNEIDQNTGKGFGPWRGAPVDFLAHWADAYNGSVWYLPGIENSSGPAHRFKGLLDVATGGPEASRMAAAGNGSMDDAFRTMVRKLKTLRTIDGVLYPTIMRPFHELDGNWFRWSVTASNLADAAKVWKRWRAIAKTEYPELIFALCFNGDSYNTDVAPEQIWDAFGGADLYGVDRYNQYPTIGTNRAGGYTSFASGSTAGTVSRPVGIEKHRQLAAKKGVPIYVPEYANNGYDTGTPSNASDDPYWVTTNLDYMAANAGKTAGKFLADGWFNVTGKEEDRWAIFRTDGGVIRHPAVAAGYRSWFQSNG